MTKSLCHYCALGIVYRRKHSFVNDVTIECLELKRTMPDDVVECSRFRNRSTVDPYGRNMSDEAANQAIRADAYALVIDTRKKPAQYL